MLPILYSFRRCPYAIRARMALFYAGIEVELREILLRDKPMDMLRVSQKGTVPVLILPDGNVLDESCVIMHWALDQSDPDQWYFSAKSAELDEIIQNNDGLLKNLWTIISIQIGIPNILWNTIEHRQRFS